MRYIALKLMVLALCVTSPMLAHAVEVSSNASITIVRSLTVSKTSDLNYGFVELGPNSDVISIGFNSSISSQNGDITARGGATPAEFQVIGEPDANFNISITETSLTGSGATIPMQNMQHDAGATPRFDTSGVSSFKVVGDLLTNAAQEPGVYTGQYQISVNYP